MGVSVPTSAQPLVSDASSRTGLPRGVVAAQISEESGFNPKAVSPKGAQGEFQFMPGTFAAQHTGGSPFDPKAGERAYVKLMSTLLRQYKGNVRNALAAYNAGPGNLGAGLGYADTILKNAGVGSGLNASPNRTVTALISAPGFTTKQIGGQLDPHALALAVLSKEASRPIDTSGRVNSGGNPLGDIIGAVKSGKFNTPTQTIQVPTSGSLRTGGLPIPGGSGNINPISKNDGWVYGRNDMGVDANAHPGAPIRALNDSRVVDIVHNWYAGQPLILMRILSGPDAGKYWYASEQISHSATIGQIFRKGEVVARYAPSGTGIEIGWGDPHSGARTLAAAQGNTGGPSHSNAPAGINFRNQILSLK